jgi:uncharacterized protein (TIGR03437 family)
MKTQTYSTFGRWIFLGGLGFALAVLAWLPWQAAQARPVAAVALVNAASYDTTVAPGSIAALFGSELTALGSQSATTVPLPNSLAGLSVKINGLTAPLFFASANQVNLQVPSGVAPGTANIEVFNGSATTPVGTGTVTVAEAAPGLFTADLSGKGQVIALNADYSRNADFDRFPGSRPEITSSYVTIYATGIGNTNPLVADGQAAPGTPAEATGTTSVTIGGVAAQVLFSGLAPGLVGLWQINAVLPASLPTNVATNVTVQLKGKSSFTATLAVANKDEFGTVAGTVVSALSGAPLAGANVIFQPASGNPRTALTNAAGAYSLNVINPGSYNATVAVNGFITAAQTSAVTGGQTLTANFALTPPLLADQYRVIINWQGALDLDAHLTGPKPDSARFHVWWGDASDLLTPSTSALELDNINPGPEILTFTPAATGTYRFSLHNYTDRDLLGNTRLAQAGAVVRVYRGSQQVAAYTAPAGGGTLWKVFEINNGQLTAVNQLTDEVDASNIKTSF